MQALKIIIQRGWIALYSLLCGIYNRVYCKEKNNNRIVVFFPQQLGDILLFSVAMNKIAEIYPTGMGYDIELLVRQEVKDFIMEVLPINPGVNIRSIDYHRLSRDFPYFRRVKKMLLHDVNCFIVPDSSIISELVGAEVSAPNKIAVVSAFGKEMPWYRKMFSWLAYTRVIVPCKESMAFERHRALVMELGGAHYKIELPRLIFDRKKNADKYCIISPGASLKEKQWPVEKYVAVVNYILKTQKIKIFLTGNASDVGVAEIIKVAADRPERVVIKAGKTSYEEWVAMIAGARFYIGADSAGVHIAAALRTPCICITGSFDRNQFFPYHIENRGQKTRLPIVIRKECECAWCRAKGQGFGYGNGICKRQIRLGKPALCIEHIDVSEVIEKLADIV